ncbi:unnamed protein product [Caenorhabditis auriculariae]|uniref:Integrator complex subunit 4/Protein SIEL C-terminal Ig-like domain-containing protein n=1 Tax=Caenorhabditis auriculariae TaxID=2777116 RepID=A0A8S1GPZ0_9PELO|nr:unnamed protein product [Caenorhabditis auriculariae]
MAVPQSSIVRKRTLPAEAVRTKKKKLNENTTAPTSRRPRKTYKRRSVTIVVEDLLTSLERRLTSISFHLIRELHIEHGKTTRGAELESVATNLVMGAIRTKDDSVASKVLGVLFAFMNNATIAQWRRLMDFLTNNEEANKLFLRSALDHKIIKFYTLAMSKGILKYIQLPEKVHHCLERCIAQSLISLGGSHRRVIVARFHIAVASTESADENRLRIVEKTLCRMLNDRDCRVRRAALEGLSTFMDRAKPLSKRTYSALKEVREDVDKNIRLTVLRLLVYFANKMPTENVAGTGKTPVTLSDDAFTAVCDAINDIETSVRAEAAKVLGEFTNVSDDLLYQTLDKKLMRSNKAAGVIKMDKSMFSLSKGKKDAAKEGRWRFNARHKGKNIQEASEGWSRGKELHSKAPTTKPAAEEEDSIIPHGACGAFVTALEDEFMDVRKAAVYSLGTLAASRPPFAISALEYLADMFNDEIAEVRLDAIYALTPLIVHSQLSCEQLNVILKCLDDGMPESRQAMRELLKKAAFADVDCIDLCVEAMLMCMKRFPDDQNAVFECMAAIGLNHSVQVQAMARRLLGIHPLFHAREQPITDVKYLTKLILVLNAASKQESIVSVLPPFMRAHYRFLRSSSAHMVKPVKALDDLKKDGRSSFKDGGEKAEKIIERTYERLRESSCTTSLEDRNILRNNISHDSQAITAYNDNVSGAARLIYCLTELNMAVDNVAQTVFCSGEIVDALRAIHQHLLDIQCIECQFAGVSADLSAYLIHCRLYLTLLEIAGTLILNMAEWQRGMLRGRNAVIVARERLSRLQVAANSSTNDFLVESSSLFDFTGAGVNVKKVTTAGALCNLLEKFAPILPPKLPPAAEIALKWANITKPNKDAALESAVKFISGLPHAILLEAQLHNLKECDFERIRIKIGYPDSSSMLVKPRQTDFKTTNGDTVLSTQIMMTAASCWSESAEVALTVVILVGPNSSIPLYSSPTCLSTANVRVKIHPVSRK